MRWLVLASLIGGGALAVGALLRPAAAPRPSLIRLVDHLAEARRVVQKPEKIDPEILHLKPGAIPPPAGWTAIPGEVAHFVAPSVRPIHLRVDVPIEGGRDYVVRAMAKDPTASVRVLLMHAPNLEQPEVGWHRATEERAGDRVRFDWREDTSVDEKVLPVVIESEGLRELELESLSVREAGARDPSVIEAAPAVALHGLVDRPVEGAKSAGKRGARRLLASLLSTEDGVYEWALERPAPTELVFQTATVPRGSAGAPLEMRVELEFADGWKRVWSQTRGGDEPGYWRAARVEIPPQARAIRLATARAGDGDPVVVAWGNPILRDRPAGKKHVLLITLDAVRPDHLSSYGYARPTSPFLDKLASRGARFTDVEAQRSHTWASTTSLITGLFPQSNGVLARGDRPLRGLGGLGAAFADAGYTTARVGSPDLPRGQLSAFDDVEIADYDTDVMARLGELGREYADRPLFLWVHVSTAHYPWRVADAFNHFDSEYSGPFKSGLSRAEFRALSDAGVPEPLRRHLEALYDDAILQMDQRLGAELAALDDVGFFDDAVIAISADHGAHFGEHDAWFMHSTPWHASLAVPLLIVAPRVKPGTIVNGRALLVDLAPTLIDLAGLPAGEFDGVSLVPTLEGGAIPARTTVTRFDPASYVVVENDDWKLLLNPKKEALGWPGELKLTLPLPELALYDRKKDPDEKIDVSAAHPEVVRALTQAAERDAAAHSAGGAGTHLGTHLSGEARRLLQQAGYLDDQTR